MKAEKISEYKQHGCHFTGELLLIDYSQDMKADSRYGQFGANVTFDYIAKARSIASEFNVIEVLLAIPDYVCRIKEQNANLA